VRGQRGGEEDVMRTRYLAGKYKLTRDETADRHEVRPANGGRTNIVEVRLSRTRAAMLFRNPRYTYRGYALYTRLGFTGWEWVRE
jgi:hypothetical protein